MLVLYLYERIKMFGDKMKHKSNDLSTMSPEAVMYQVSTMMHLNKSMKTCETFFNNYIEFLNEADSNDFEQFKKAYDDSMLIFESIEKKFLNDNVIPMKDVTKLAMYIAPITRYIQSIK